MEMAVRIGIAVEGFVRRLTPKDADGKHDSDKDRSQMVATRFAECMVPDRCLVLIGARLCLSADRCVLPFFREPFFLIYRRSDWSNGDVEACEEQDEDRKECEA